MPEIFRALGDPIRVSIVERLGAHGDATVNELATMFPVSLQAVSKHIKVLEAAGVVSQRREGRHRPVHLEAERVVAATNWLASRVREMDARFGRLDDLLADLQRSERSTGTATDRPTEPPTDRPTDRSTDERGDH